MKKIAFILAGCGGLDGTEIHEALYAFLATKQLGYDYKCFAIDKEQFFVKNYITNEINTKEQRNVLLESARLTKYNNIYNLDNLNVDDFDILFFPGGYGSALNISTFLKDGENYIVDEKVKNIILKFKKLNKPICAVCIAPMILAEALKDIKITIGNDSNIAKIIENKGNIHINTNSNNICVDEQNKIITSPCFMLTKNIEIVYNEVYKVIKKAIELV